MTVYR